MEFSFLKALDAANNPAPNKGLGDVGNFALGALGTAVGLPALGGLIGGAAGAPLVGGLATSLGEALKLAGSNPMSVLQAGVNAGQTGQVGNAILAQGVEGVKDYTKILLDNQLTKNKIAKAQEWMKANPAMANAYVVGPTGDLVSTKDLTEASRKQMEASTKRMLAGFEHSEKMATRREQIAEDKMNAQTKKAAVASAVNDLKEHMKVEGQFDKQEQKDFIKAYAAWHLDLANGVVNPAPQQALDWKPGSKRSWSYTPAYSSEPISSVPMPTPSRVVVKRATSKGKPIVMYNDSTEWEYEK